MKFVLFIFILGMGVVLVSCNGGHSTANGNKVGGDTSETPAPVISHPQAGQPDTARRNNDESEMISARKGTPSEKSKVSTAMGRAGMMGAAKHSQKIKKTAKQKNAVSHPDQVVASSHATGSAAIDLNAFNNSQGVGAFHHVQEGSSINAAMAEQGQEIFETRCTTCHQPTNQRMIGPGLKGITRIRTPAWIMNMITNPDKMVQRDSVAKALYNEFNQTQMTNQGLTNQEAREVLEFFRQNDSQ